MGGDGTFACCAMLLHTIYLSWELIWVHWVFNRNRKSEISAALEKLFKEFWLEDRMMLEARIKRGENRGNFSGT